MKYLICVEPINQVPPAYLKPLAQVEPALDAAAMFMCTIVVCFRAAAAAAEAPFLYKVPDICCKLVIFLAACSI